MKRSYKQNCSLAQALDIVGERWTLLIVRELLVAPRRYKDLLDNLAGIGTNLLANRLKEMEANGLVAKQDSLYTLTDTGRSLQHVIWELVRFGLARDVADDPDRLTRSEWDAVALRALYDADRDRGLAGRYLLRLNQHPFCVEVHRSGVTVSPGECDGYAAAVSLDKLTARQLASGSLEPGTAEQNGGLIIEGSRREAKRLLDAFSLTAS